MKTVIIDDKTPTREKLKKLLAIYTPEVEITAEADGVETGLACIQANQPELVLLDVEMGDGTGFDLLALCPNPDFKVIFITAHNGYAIKAFRFSAIDYILKPIDPDDLIRAVGKMKSHQNRAENQLLNQTFLNNRNAQKEEKKLVLSDNDNVYLVGVNEIVRCESESNYTKFFLTENRVLLIAKTLKEYEETLDNPHFFRAHRSHLINLKYFSRLEKKDGGTIHMKDGSTLPVAVRRKDLLLEALKCL